MYGSRPSIRQAASSRRDLTDIPGWLQAVVFLLGALAVGIIVGAIVGFVLTGEDIQELRKRGTNIGDLLAGCQPGQVVRFDGTQFFCGDDVMVLDDLDDVSVPDPEDEQCLCFNRTEREWGPQGPFVRLGDIPVFVNGTLPCENLPDNGGAPLCNALRWGTFAGLWDANTNAPLLMGGGCPLGDFYVVAVAGATNLDGNAVWDAGDAVACSATGWKRIGKNAAVLSVNGMIGDVSLSLGVLTDVDLTGQANGDFLQRVGGLWTPQQLLVALNDLLDVATAGAVAGDALVFNGTDWVPDSECCLGGDTAQRQGVRVRQRNGDQPIPSGAGNPVMELGAVLDDPGGNFNSITHRYTAPITGYYGAWLTATFREPATVITGWTVRARLRVNAGDITLVQRFVGTTNTNFMNPIHDSTITLLVGFFRMDAGDILDATVGQFNTQGTTVLISGSITSRNLLTVMFHGPV